MSCSSVSERPISGQGHHHSSPAGGRGVGGRIEAAGGCLALVTLCLRAPHPAQAAAVALAPWGAHRLSLGTTRQMAQEANETSSSCPAPFGPSRTEHKVRVGSQARQRTDSPRAKHDGRDRGEREGKGGVKAKTVLAKWSAATVPLFERV